MDPRPLLRSVTLCLVGFSAPAAHSQVVINEFAYDDSGPDDEEFVELFNAGDTDVEVTGWSLETGSDAGPGPRYDLPDGRVIEPRGYLVVGNSRVPRVEVVLPSSGTLCNGPAYVILRREDGEIADRVVYEANKGLAGFPAEALAEGAIWGNHVLVAATHMSWQRWSDGRDTERNDEDFGHLPWTPGTSNDRSAPPLLASDFEDGNPEQAVDRLPGSFVPGRFIDPQSVSRSNPGAVPESPDGGLALVAWDPAGGGNLIVLEAEPAADMMFEAWVYFDAVPELPDESETWSMGLRGTSGTFFNIPILFDANGNTGVTWTYQVTSSGATLYLIDEGHGGPAAGRPHLGTVEIVPGENDGWRRLRLEVEGDRVVGHFDGTYGSTDDGIRLEGRLRSPALGNFYIGYREAVGDNTSVRPPTIDALVVGSTVKEGPLFQRGNANADGRTDLSDAVMILNYLFLGSSEPPCLAAADVDDDGQLNLTDAIGLLNFLFLGGRGPMKPFPGCGPDPTMNELDCADFPPCQ